MGKYFGTDGFRGEANKNLTYDHAVKIGRFLGWYYGANHVLTSNDSCDYRKIVRNLTLEKS